VEGGGVLGRVGGDRERLVPGVVERSAERGDAPVHHVARADGVGARVGVADRRAPEQLERLVVHDAVLVDDAAVPVRRVLAEAHVGEEQQVREAVAQLAQRLLDDAVRVPGAGALVVLRVRDPEQDHARDAGRSNDLDLARKVGDGEAPQGGKPLVGACVGADEERHHEVAAVDGRLADEVAERAGAAQTAEAGLREGAHQGDCVSGTAVYTRRRRAASRASAHNAAVIATSQAASAPSVRHGLTSYSAAEKKRSACTTGKSEPMAPATRTASDGTTATKARASATAASRAVRASRASAATRQPSAPSEAPASTSPSVTSGMRCQGSPPRTAAVSITTPNASAMAVPSRAATTAPSATFAVSSSPSVAGSRPITVSSRAAASEPAASSRASRPTVSVSAYACTCAENAHVRPCSGTCTSAIGFAVARSASPVCASASRAARTNLRTVTTAGVCGSVASR